MAGLLDQIAPAASSSGLDQILPEPSLPFAPLPGSDPLAGTMGAGAETVGAALINFWHSLDPGPMPPSPVENGQLLPFNDPRSKAFRDWSMRQAAGLAGGELGPGRAVPRNALDGVKPAVETPTATVLGTIAQAKPVIPPLTPSELRMGNEYFKARPDINPADHKWPNQQQQETLDRIVSELPAGYQAKPELYPGSTSQDGFPLPDHRQIAIITPKGETVGMVDGSGYGMQNKWYKDIIAGKPVEGVYTTALNAAKAVIDRNIAAGKLTSAEGARQLAQLQRQTTSLGLETQGTLPTANTNIANPSALDSVKPSTTVAPSLIDQVATPKHDYLDVRSQPNMAAVTEPFVEKGLSQNVVNAAEQMLQSGGVRRDASRLLSDQVFELMQTNRLNPEQVKNIINVSGISLEDFAKVWRGSVTTAARTLNSLSQVEARLRMVAGDDPAASGVFDALRDPGLPPEARAMSIWRRIDNVRRGAMVTQFATAARNAVTQVGRMGLDVLDQGVQSALQKTFGAGQATRISPLDGLDALVNLAKSPATKKQVDYVLSAFPKDQDMLFSNFASDVARPQGPLSHVENAVNVLNTVNRAQEFIIRRAVFAARLDQQLAGRGLSLDQVVKDQNLGAIRPEEIQKAVSDSLDMTWAKSFPVNTGAGAFINAVNRTPGASLLAPFPRFMMNALRFQYQFSPAGYLRLLSSGERNAIAAGDYSAISRATIGTGLLLAAYQFRNSPYAGEKWYEIKDGDRRIDTRSYNPFASYLFVADLLKRVKDGTIDQLSSSDMLSGVAGFSMRAGVGLYAVDQVMNGLAGIKDGEKAKKLLLSTAGSVVGSFLTPFATLKDFIGQFDQSQAINRNTDTAPFAGEALRNVPYAQSKLLRLPPVYLPTQPQPSTREAPLLRQATGITLTMPKNAAQQELDRLGFSTRDIQPKTGLPELDQLIARGLGNTLPQVVTPLIKSPGYQSWSNQKKAFVLDQLIQQNRAAVMISLEKSRPDLFAKLKIQKLPMRLQRLIESNNPNAAGVFGNSMFRGQ